MMLKWIDEVCVESVLDNENRTANTEISVELSCDWQQEGLYLWARIEDRAGREADAIFPIPVEKTMNFCMRVSDPILWNAENSYCYRIVVEVRDEQKEVLDRKEVYTAYYKWEVLDGDNCLNGKKVVFRTRKLPQECTEEEQINEFLLQLKREFCNSVLAGTEQVNEYLEEKCMEYGIYLIAPGKNLEYGRITAELEQNSQENHFLVNPDYSIQVIRDGALIENHATFINTSDYQLVFEIRKGDTIVQKGKLHVDIPAGESKYVNLPYMELRDAGIFTYRVSLCLESGVLWESAGYEIAYAENHLSNLFL